LPQLTLLVLAVGVFHALTLRQGHDWGDDFAMYVHHARNLAEGVPYADTGFVVNPSAPFYAPPSYPPVFPLLLVPVYLARGLDLTAMKAVVVLFFVLALAAIARLFRDELSPPLRLLLIGTLGLNPYFWILKDQVLADVPFLFFVCATLLLVQRSANTAATSRGAALARGALTGAVAYAAYGTRTVGLVLLPCLLLHDVVGHRRIRRETAVALLVFAVPALLQHTYLPSGTSYYAWFSLEPALVASHALRYAGSLRLLWDGGRWPLLAYGVIAGTTLLAAWGLVERLRGRITIVEIFVLLYPLPVLTFRGYQGLRYLVPLVPFYLFYALWAVERLRLTRPLAGRVALIAWVAVIGLSYGLRYPGMAYGHLRDGVGTPDAVDLFAFVKTGTPASAVLVFRKPRALSLFAERHAAISHEARSDEEQWQFLARIRATHLVVGRREGPHWRSFVERNRAALELVHANPGFAVYRVACVPSPAARGGRPSAAGDVRRHGQPATAPARPHVRVAAGARGAVGPGVGRPRVDQGDVAHDPDDHVPGLETGDPHRTAGLDQEGRPVQERPVGVGAHEVLGQDLVEAAHVGLLDRSDVLAVEVLQRVEIGGGGDRGRHASLPGSATPG
jgi:hypothetical protein